MKAKIYIPNIEEYEAIVLEDAEEFKRFIGDAACHIEVKQINGELTEISFKWNPYAYDYPPSVSVKKGEMFMYNVDDKDCYKVMKSIPDWWVVNGFEK